MYGREVISKKKLPLFLINPIKKEILNLFKLKNLFYPHLRVVKDGISTEEANYVISYSYNNRSNFINIIDKYKLNRLYNNGSSIVFTHANRLSQRLDFFSKKLNSEIKLPNHLNFYFTPKDSQGYKIHYDKHNVIVIQLDGEKIWKIYNKVPDNKIMEPFMQNLHLLKKETENLITLKRGDILFVPKGYFHDVSTNQKKSFHLTIGLNPSKFSNDDLEKSDSVDFIFDK